MITIKKLRLIWFRAVMLGFALLMLLSCSTKRKLSSTEESRHTATESSLKTDTAARTDSTATASANARKKRIKQGRIRKKLFDESIPLPKGS